GDVLLEARAPHVTAVIAVIIIIARRGGVAYAAARHVGYKLLALLVPDVAELAVDYLAGSHLDTGACGKAPFLEGLVVGDPSALGDAAVISRRVPESALGAETEIVGDIGVDADRGAPAPLRLLGAFGVPAADSSIRLGPEAPES